MYNPFTPIPNGDFFVALDDYQKQQKNIDLNKMRRLREASLIWPTASLASLCNACGIKYSGITDAEKEWWRAQGLHF